MDVDGQEDDPQDFPFHYEKHEGQTQGQNNEVDSEQNTPTDLQSQSSNQKSVAVEPFDFFKLPAEACAYCGIHDPRAIVQCIKCNKWFCNGKGHQNDLYGSHMVWHLVKSNHKEVALHHESPLKDSPLECYLCGSKNMFLLGYISAKTEACIVLLCREPCLSQISA